MPDVIRYVLAFAIVFGLLAIFVMRSGRGLSFRWNLPGSGNGKEHCLLRQAGSIRLTPQHSVHLVEYGDQTWLIACSQVGVTLIGEAKSRPESGGSPQ